MPPISFPSPPGRYAGKAWSLQTGKEIPVVSIVRGVNAVRPHEIREFNNEELTKELEGAQRALLNLRFRLATKQLNNTSEIRAAKKNLARLNTIARERQLEVKIRWPSRGAKSGSAGWSVTRWTRRWWSPSVWQQRHRLYQEKPAPCHQILRPRPG